MLYSIGKVAQKLGVTTTTLRNWDKAGILIPDKVTDGGTRYYSDETLNKYLHRNMSKDKRVIGYCRVSSNKQKNDLERQIDNVRTYLLSKGYNFEIITDIGSGINYNKKGLHKLLDAILNGEVSKVVILYKDRLVRFGYELIEYLCDKYDTKIEIIDMTEKTEEEELVEDLIQIVTVFSCRLEGKRVKRIKELMQEIKKECDAYDRNDEIV